MVPGLKGCTMRPLLLLDCPLAIRFCLVVTCSLMLALTPSYAERPAEFSERESLSGLSGVKVLTERERLATQAGGFWSSGWMRSTIASADIFILSISS